MATADPRSLPGVGDIGLAEVYLDAYPQLVRMAAYLHPDGRAGAEDAVQEAYVRVLSRQPEVAAPDGVRSYLRRAVVNVCRSAGRRRAVSERYLAGVARSDARGAGRDGAGPDDRFARHELVVALQSLPRRQREVVVLRHYAGFSEAETAATLGIAVGTVKGAGSRGLSALAGKLEVAR